MDRKDDSTGRDAETTRQRALLLLALEKGPAGLSMGELKAVSGSPADIDAAVEALIADDLFVRDGDKLMATPVATRLYKLIRLAGRLQGTNK